MNAAEIRQLNEECQKKAIETGNDAQHDAALVSLELSLLAELTAQVAEMNGHLVKVANPLLSVDFSAPGKITVMEPHATLRDQFAMAAFTGILSTSNSPIKNESCILAAGLAYRLADAMLEARRKS